MRAKLINEKFKKEGDPIKDMNIGMNLERYVTEKFEEEGIDMSYEEFLIELDDRIATQGGDGIIRDLYTLIKILQEQQKYEICDNILNNNGNFLDEAIVIIMKMLQKISFEKQKEFVETILNDLIDKMK